MLDIRKPLDSELNKKENLYVYYRRNDEEPDVLMQLKAFLDAEA